MCYISFMFVFNFSFHHEIRYQMYMCISHRYMYWNEQGNGLFRGPLDEFQSSECSPPSTKETIFSSSPVVDFVLEPEVFIYFTADQVVQFVGFDKENNGTIEGSEAMFLESFGDATVVIFNNITRLCNATTQTCPFSVASLYSDEVYPIIDDILVFRKSKQPLPGTCACARCNFAFIQSCCALLAFTSTYMYTQNWPK